MSQGIFILAGLFIAYILAVLFAPHWRKVVNPVIESVHGLLTHSRKKEYLPPRISIEGNGIKRGLSVAKAALVSERPIPDVIGIFLNSTIEKGALRIAERMPLKFEADKLLPDILDGDERDFVRICLEKTKKKRQERLAGFAIALIKTTTNELKGFSFPETVQYYQATVESACARNQLSFAQGLLQDMVEDMDALIKAVTKATNPYAEPPTFKEIPAYLKSRGGGGSGGMGGRYGGGGCACAGCACACAGCACACAGGGR